MKVWFIFNSAGQCISGPTLREPLHKYHQDGWVSVAVKIETLVETVAIE